MIDVVHRADILAQLEQVADGTVEIVRIESALVETGGVLVFEQLDVELQAAHLREVVLARIEKHAMEQRRCRVQRRWIAGAQFAVDFDQRFLWSFYRIALEGLTDDGTNVVALGEEQAHLHHARVQNLRDLVGGDFRVGFEQHLAGGGIDDVGGGPCAFQVGYVHFDFADLRFLNIFQDWRVDLAAGMRNLLARF